MEAKKKRVSLSGRVCCVQGCFNSERRNPYLNFYSFPNRNYEVERKKKWIEAVRRTRKDENWMPNSNSRVCSIHFAGGEKSNIAAHESYVPSIFSGTPSWELLKFRITSDSTSRTEDVAQLVAREDFEKEDSWMNASDKVQPKSVTIACQTEDWTNDDPRCPDTLFCWTGQNKASTQTNIFMDNHIPNLQPIIVQEIEKKDAACGTGMEMNPGFLGAASIKSDKSMQYLAGVSQAAFHSFLELMTPRECSQPAYYKKVSRENRLLMFLMKIKLGLAYTTLGTLFCIHRTTASRIFVEVLETLVEKTKTWIVWPSKESVRKKLPSLFHNYPTCRCIIDCVEIRIDTPATIEQRIFMYSSYKDCFTSKFLIAITPDGFVCKVSKGYGGRATDSFITNDCGFLDLIEKGDQVLAVKGFPQIKSELAKHDCTLVTPPFAFNPQFSAEEVNEGCKIASVRSHVERAIQRVKSSSILKHVTADLLPYIDAIMHMCCVIANLQPPLIKGGDGNR